MDLLFHIYQSLKTNGYQGVPIHNITRDEVQDFTQAELLVDLRYAARLLSSGHVMSATSTGRCCCLARNELFLAA